MSSLQLVSAYPYGEKWDPVLLNGLLSTIVLSNITGTEILASTIPLPILLRTVLLRIRL
jgi:hypothetical protein